MASMNIKIFFFIALFCLAFENSHGATQNSIIDSGNSIVTLVIKNRPYTSLYRYKDKEPYLSLIAEFKSGIITMMLGAVGNYTLPRIGSAKSESYCQLSTPVPTAVGNTVPTALPTDCSSKYVKISGILHFEYYINTGFRRIGIKEIWDKAMALGFIGNFELIPEKCVLKLELFVNSENLNSKVQSDNKNDYGTDYKAAFRKAVRSMSEIGNGLSLIGAFLTFFTLISFSKLRKRKSNLIICILCISVAAVNILNFAVQRSADYPIPCLIVAILSHFFLLSKIIWMTILAFHLYFELIKVYSTVNLLTTSKLILITTVIGFGIPILVVGIAYIADSDKIYGRNANGFCWMNAVHADALFIYPMLALVGVNFVIFILIFYQVRKLSKDRDGNFTLSQMRALMALVTALGLAWIFVLLTYIEKPVFLKNIAEVLFVVCTSLQGFFLYYFYCVSKDEVRACYMKLFGYQPLSQTQSGTSTKPTNGSSRNLTRIGRDLRSYHSEKSISPSVSTQKIAENTTYKTNLTSNDTTKRGSACSSLTGSQLEKIEEENIANAEEAKEVKSSTEKAISSNDGNSGTVNIAFEAESASSKSTNEDEITFEGKKKEKRVSLQINGKIEFPEKSVELTIEEVKPEIQIADASKEYDITANDDRV